MNKRLMWGGALVALTVWSGGVRAQAASAPEAEQAAVPVASEASKSGVIDKGIDIAMASAIPYLDEGNIADNIVNECKGLGLALSSSVSRRSKAQGFNVNRDEHFDATKSKQALDIKIVSAVSGGNAFIGHHKSVSIRAELASWCPRSAKPATRPAALARASKARARCWSARLKRWAPMWPSGWRPRVARLTR